MASYSNFQSKNAKYTRNRSNHIPEHNATVKAKSITQCSHLETNLNKYIEFLSWARWNLDLFFDLIRPKTGGINLHSDQRTFIRAVGRFHSMYGVFVRGYGKCVAGDTMVYTKDGIKEIGEFFNYYKGKSEEWIGVDNLDVINRYGVLEKVSSLYYGGYKNTKKIITEFGYDVEGTLNHPLLILDKDGLIKWRNIEDIKVGDFVVVNRNNDVWGNKDDIDKSKELKLWVNTLSKQSSSHLKITDMPKILDDNLSLFFGYLVGDGCLTRDNVILFSNKDKDIINNFKEIAEIYFNTDVNKVKENNVDYVIYNKYLRKYLEVLGFELVGAHNKSIPKCILSGSKSNVANFLKGLFDTDGYVGRHTVVYYTVSEKLAKQVQFLLLNFGILSSRRKKTNKHNQSHWLVAITGSNIDIYASNIGFSSNIKKSKLLKYVGIKRNTNKDIIPHQKNIINGFYHDIKKYNKYIYREIHHVIRGDNELTYDKLNKLLSFDNADKCDNYKHLKELQSLNYFFAKVEDIQDNLNYTYDLSLPLTHSFVSNGIVSHNTFLEVLIMYGMCCLYPGIEFALTAQTKENAAELLSDKHKDITKKYPWFKNEIINEKFSRNDAEVLFLNDSRVDILANSQTSKGQRRHIINIEESVLMDDTVFQDALYPIVEHGRLTVGELGLNNPEELSQRVNFFSTAGFRGSDEFERNIRMKNGMLNLSGEIILGSDWKLGCWYGRGSTKKQIMKKKEDMSPITFAQNYESKWVGTTDNALVDIKKLLRLRTLSMPEVKGEEMSEYYLGVDVARSYNSSNNQSSTAVLKVIRDNRTQRISAIQLVNLVYVPTFLNFTAQATILKRLKYIYNAKMAVVDMNGLGKGFYEELLKEHIDPLTGAIYPCWDSINTEDKPENPYDADKCLFGITSQGIQNDIIVNFIDVVEGEKLELLEKHSISYNLEDKEYIENVVTPKLQTDFLVEEISNLQLVHLDSGKLGIKQVTKRVDKDKAMAVMYGLYYIMKYENVVLAPEVEVDLSALLSVFKKPLVRA